MDAWSATVSRLRNEGYSCKPDALNCLVDENTLNKGAGLALGPPAATPNPVVLVAMSDCTRSNGVSTDSSRPDPVAANRAIPGEL